MSQVTILTGRQSSGAEVRTFSGNEITIGQLYSNLGLDASKYAFKVNSSPATRNSTVADGDQIAETPAKQASAADLTL